MKKPIVLSVIMAFTLLMGSSLAPAQPQDTANEEKPTFYRLTPGVYVNGWPRFTISYPKDWVERSLATGALFSAAPSGSSRLEGTRIFAGQIPLPLDKHVDFMVPYFRAFATDVTVLGDKPSQLRDGTPARELEFKMMVNGVPYNWLGVATKKGDLLISANVGSFKGKIGEDLRAIPYSIKLEPGKDEPVKVPPDVKEFFGKLDNDIVSHDVAKVMTHYSDRFLNSGTRKGEIERFWRQYVGSITSQKVSITELAPAGYRAYLTGFVIFNFGTYPITETSIIKENGEWKWYGNQRNVSP
jgi:hypothetical protein